MKVQIQTTEGNVSISVAKDVDKLKIDLLLNKQIFIDLLM